MELDKQIEAILFFKGEPIKLKKLAEWLEVREETAQEALEVLKQNLASRGLVLLTKDDEVALGTAPETAEVIEKITKEEFSKDLGKATLETLSIIIYKGPISRPEIDYIRGVNSSFILRNLMVRGLVERITKPDDSRSYLYKPTFDLLSYLGVSDISEMPEFAEVKEKINNFVSEQKLNDESK